MKKSPNRAVPTVSKKKASTPNETVTEGIFRKRYGNGTFIEKTAIPLEYGFKSKNGTNCPGYPDFFKVLEDFAIIVEAKAIDHDAAVKEACFYTSTNTIDRDIISIAVSGQSTSKLKVTYFYRELGSKDVVEIDSVKDALLELSDLEKLYTKTKYGTTTTTEGLVSVLKDLNNRFHKDGKVRATDRSLFFSGLLIALNSRNFRKNWRSLDAPEKHEIASTQATVLQAHNLNEAIVKAISSQLNSKINSLSKEFSWQDKFSFIKNIDYPLAEYKDIIEIVWQKVFKPFKVNEKQDILGRAYKIFLSRAGKAENKNIILTPDHIKALMVKLAQLTKDDVVLDTCTGSGGFLMESMETMIALSNGAPEKIKSIKEKQLIGFEVDSVLFALACSNMFLHGDGKTNLLYRSSLLNIQEGEDDGDNEDLLRCVVNSTDEDLLAYIKSLKPTKGIINPPYEKNNSIRFAIQALQYLENYGKLIIIMPTPTLTQNQNGLTEELLKMAKLDFVIKMPENLFSEQQRGVHTSIFGFTKTPHDKDCEVLFYTLKDDGLISVQHKGKLDLQNKWRGIETQILSTVINKKTIPGLSISKSIVDSNGKYQCAGVQSDVTFDSGYELVSINQLFDISKGDLASEKADLTGVFDFITAAEGWKRHTSFSHDKEALVYAVGSQGSLGRCHYVNGKFVASNLCLILTPKHPNSYPINMGFYQKYFSIIRPKIVEALADGTSKKTINPHSFGNYKIEYVPLNKQNEFMENNSKRLDALLCQLKAIEASIQMEQDEQRTMFHCLKD